MCTSYSVFFNSGGKLNPDAFTQCLGGALQGQERDGHVIRIEESLKGRAAGLHPLGQLQLGQLLFFHEFTELKSDHTLGGNSLRFSQQPFLIKKIVKLATDVLAHLISPNSLCDPSPVADPPSGSSVTF